MHEACGALADVLADKEGAISSHRVSGRSLNGTTREHTQCETRDVYVLHAWGAQGCWGRKEAVQEEETRKRAIGSLSTLRCAMRPAVGGRRGARGCLHEACRATGGRACEQGDDMLVPCRQAVIYMHTKDSLAGAAVREARRVMRGTDGDADCNPECPPRRPCRVL
jgi:hypothetical protein